MQDLFLGTGGLIGMSAALLGEAVPGHGSAIAVGNAMGQGPPVFHLPQPLIDSILEGAASGNADMQQLELDMFRLAALSLLLSTARPLLCRPADCWAP